MSSIEVFFAPEGVLVDWDTVEPLPAGWYWWACFPGCLPDTPPMGPFDSETEALVDSRDAD